VRSTTTANAASDTIQPNLTPNNPANVRHLYTRSSLSYRRRAPLLGTAIRRCNPSLRDGAKRQILDIVLLPCNKFETLYFGLQRVE
jgi:hypothetical protein